jgi:hypothetical protein
VGSWATWRRAWRYFDQRIGLWPLLRDGALLESVLDHESLVKFYKRVLDAAFAAEGNVSYWDYQWSFSCWANRGLAIVPRVNLVSNVGWGSDATHSADQSHPSLDLPALEMPFPLVHPPVVLDDMGMDRQWLLGESLRHEEMPDGLPQRLARAARRMRVLAKSVGIIGYV